MPKVDIDTGSFDLQQSIDKEREIILLRNAQKWVETQKYIVKKMRTITDEMGCLQKGYVLLYCDDGRELLLKWKKERQSFVLDEIS